MSRLSEAAVLAALKTAVSKAGSPTAFGRKAGVSAGYVLDVQRGLRPPGPKILSALGLERAVVEIEGGADGRRR